MNDKLEKLLKLKKEALIRQCRQDFWTFCKVFSPRLSSGKKIFRDDVAYLKNLANKMQALIEDADKLGICISMPPRHAKSLLSTYFLRWYIGKYTNNKIMHISYSLKLVQEFSRQTRSWIQDNLVGDFGITYKDIFDIELSKDTKSKSEWKLKGADQISYKNGTFSTAATGSGCQLLLVDDPHKDSQEALNKELLEQKWDTFRDTFLSRRESGAKIIVIQTRWSKWDLIGMLQSSQLGAKFEYIVETVRDSEGHMLNEDFLSNQEFEDLEKVISDHILRANYFQELIDLKNTLYTNLQFYDEIPGEHGNLKKVAFLDPSASGSDYTACVTGWLDKKLNKIYLTNIFFDNSPIGDIEDKLYAFIRSEQVSELVIEANGAFTILSNNLKKHFKKVNYQIKVKEFAQTKNKEARILNCAKSLQDSILFMSDFKTTHKEAFKHITEFKSDIKKNSHDDLEDALTGLYEHYLLDDIKGSYKVLDRMF